MNNKYNMLEFFIRGINYSPRDVALVPERQPEENPVEKTEQILKKVAMAMPNKNCGLLLSGGIDSSLICALMGKAGKRFKTYTGGCLDKKIDDSKWAEYYVPQTITIIPTISQQLQTSEMLSNTFNEPLYSSTDAILYHITKRAAGDGIDTLISCDGGDELFWAYKRYPRVSYDNEKWNDLLYTKAERIYYGFHLHAWDELNELCNITDHSKGDIIPTPTFNWLINHSDISIDRLISFFDQTWVLSQIQARCKRIGDLCGVKFIFPYMDPNLINYVNSLPLIWRYKNNQLRYIQREIAKRYLSDKILNRPKQGFPSDLIPWIYSSDCYRTMKKILFTELNQKTANRIIKNHFGKTLNPFYNLLVLAGRRKIINFFLVQKLFHYALWKERG